jgi:hypothetical protein
MTEMDTHTEQRRRALTAFKEKGGFAVGRWEKEAGLGDGTLRKFLDGVATTITDRTIHRLAEGAAKILKRPVTEAELLGDQPPAGSRVFISSAAEDSSTKELISRLMNELYDPDTMPAGSDKEKVVIALARHLRKQASK